MRTFVAACVVFLSFPITSFADFGFSLNGENLTPSNPPILFLPGFQGSRLYAKQGDALVKAWEPLTNSRLSLLEMDTDGTSIREVRVGTVIDAIDVFEGVLFKFSRIYGISINEYLADYPDSLIETIDTQLPSPLRLEDFLITADNSMTWYTYPYDWRQDVLDIVENGTLRTTGEIVRLDEVVEKLYEVAQEPVHIVAHSNGGLLARALMIHLQEENKEDMVASVTLVGSPQSGTPKTIAALLHGYEQGRFFGIVTNGNTSRTISKNMPGAYALLPFETYFENESEPVAYKKSSLPDKYETWFESPVDTFTKFSRFITNIPNSEGSTKLNIPLELNQKLFDRALHTHRKLHSWNKPEELRFYQIAGIGNQTITSFTYESNLGKECPRIFLICHYEELITYKPVFKENGDNTVVSKSAVIGNGLFLDLKKLEESDRDVGHSNLISEKEVLSTINSIVLDSEIISDFISTTPLNIVDEEIVALSIHSPVLLSITDTLGNKTSIEKVDDTDVWQITEDVPGSFVEFVGEGKYIFAPEGNYSIEIEGIDTGSFDLKLSKITPEGVLQEIDTFNHIPTTNKTVATTNLSITSFSDLALDINGDNDVDFSFSANSTNTEIKNYLKSEFASLPLRKTLHGAIETYFELLENETDHEKRATYVRQLERIIDFLENRHITQDTAINWRALVQNLL